MYKGVRSGAVSSRAAKWLLFALLVILTLSVACPLMAEDSIIANNVPDVEAEALWSFSLTYSPRHNFPLFGNVASENAVATNVLSRSFGDGWDLTLVGVGPLESHQDGALASLGSLALSKEVGRNMTVGLELFHAPPQYGAPHLTALVPQLSWTGDALGREWNLGVQALVMLDTEPLGEDGFIWADWTILEIDRGPWTYSFKPGFVVGSGGRVTGHGTVSVEYDLGDGSVYLSMLGARTKGIDGTYTDIEPTPSVGVTYDF